MIPSVTTRLETSDGVAGQREPARSRPIPVTRIAHHRRWTNLDHPVVSPSALESDARVRGEYHLFEGELGSPYEAAQRVGFCAGLSLLFEDTQDEEKAASSQPTQRRPWTSRDPEGGAEPVSSGASRCGRGPLPGQGGPRDDELSSLSLLQRRRLKQLGTAGPALSVDCHAASERTGSAKLCVGDDLIVTPRSFMTAQAPAGSIALPTTVSACITRAIFASDQPDLQRWQDELEKTMRCTAPVSLAASLVQQSRAIRELYTFKTDRVVARGHEFCLPNVRDLLFGTVLLRTVASVKDHKILPRIGYSISRWLGMAWTILGAFEWPARLPPLAQLEELMLQSVRGYRLGVAGLERFPEEFDRCAGNIERAFAKSIQRQVDRNLPFFQEILARLHITQKGIDAAENLGVEWHDRWAAVSTLLTLGRAITPLSLELLASISNEQVLRLSVVATALWCMNDQIDWEAAWVIAQDEPQMASLAQKLSLPADVYLQKEGRTPFERLQTLIEHPLVILRQAGFRAVHLRGNDWVRSLLLKYPWECWALARTYAELPTRLATCSVDDIHKLIDSVWFLRSGENSAAWDLEACIANFQVRFKRQLSGGFLDPDDQATPLSSRRAAKGGGDEELWRDTLGGMFSGGTSSENESRI